MVKWLKFGEELRVRKEGKGNRFRQVSCTCSGTAALEKGPGPMTGKLHGSQAGAVVAELTCRLTQFGILKWGQKNKFFEPIGQATGMKSVNSFQATPNF